MFAGLILYLLPGRMVKVWERCMVCQVAFIDQPCQSFVTTALETGSEACCCGGRDDCSIYYHYTYL